MKNYTVHLYPIVRVAYDGIEAESPLDAIREAERRFVDNRAYDLVYASEYAEDINGFLVDEFDEKGEIVSSANYGKNAGEEGVTV